MAKEPLLQPDLVLNDRYRVGAVLGRGGFGEVYEAFDMQLRRRVALKYIFQPLDPAQLHSEVAILAEHAEKLRFMPNVYAYWHGQRGAGFFIVMEYVPGPTLNESQVPWPAEQVIAFLRALLGNLRDLHRRGVVHCDIKPVNIKATPDENLSTHVPYRLLDFGIARRDENTGVAAASPHYAAPEQHGLGVDEIDQRADLYALGATAYFLLTGAKPRDARERFATRMHGEPDNLMLPSHVVAGLPAELDALLQRLMALDREGRPADAGVALALMDELLAESKRPEIEPPIARDVAPDPHPGSAPTEPASQLDLAPAAQPHLARLLHRQGNGIITGMAWEPGGAALLIASTLGVYRYDIAQAACTLWQATAQPVRQLGITRHGTAALIVTAGAAEVLLLSGGLAAAPAPAPQAEQLLSAPDSDALAAVADDMLQLVGASHAAADRWRLPGDRRSRALAMAADGETIAVASAGQLSCIWPAGGRQAQHQHIGGIPQPTADLVLTADGSVAAAAGADAVVVWPVGAAAAQIFAHPGAARAALSSDAELLAVANHAAISLRRADDGQALPDLEAGDLPETTFLAFGPQDRLLAAASPRELRIWRVADGSLRAQVGGFGALAQSLAGDAGGQIMSLGEALRSWAIVGDELQPVASYPASQPTLGLAVGGAWLAAAEGAALMLRRRNGATGEQYLPAAPAQRCGLAISRDGTRLLVLAADALLVYDPAGGAELARIALGAGHGIEHATLAANCASVAWHSRGQIVVQSAADGAELGRLRPRLTGELTALALAADGRRIAAAIGGALALWEIGVGRVPLISQQPMAGAPAHQLVFAAHGQAIAALQGTEARVWLLSDDGIASEPLVCSHNERLVDAIFVGERLITASTDGALRVWRIGEI